MKRFLSHLIPELFCIAVVLLIVFLLSGCVTGADGVRRFDVETAGQVARLSLDAFKEIQELRR